MDEQYSIIWTLKNILNCFFLLCPILCLCHEIMCFWSWTRISSMNLYAQISFYSQVTRQPFESWLFSRMCEWNWPCIKDNICPPLQRVFYWNPGCVSLTKHGNPLVSPPLNWWRDRSALAACWSRRRASVLSLRRDSNQGDLLCAPELGPPLGTSVQLLIPDPESWIEDWQWQVTSARGDFQQQEHCEQDRPLLGVLLS